MAKNAMLISLYLQAPQKMVEKTIIRFFPNNNFDWNFRSLMMNHLEKNRAPRPLGKASVSWIVALSFDAQRSESTWPSLAIPLSALCTGAHGMTVDRPP